MALLNWNSTYQIGNAVIDCEHRKLFELINEFHYTFMLNRDRHDILKVLNELVKYAQEHFGHEERIMVEHGYPELETHRDIHARLFETLFTLQKRLEENSVGMEKETIDFLRNWLTDHIAEQDIALGKYLAHSH